MPHDFNHVLAEYNIAGEEELKLAADAAMAAKEEWANMPWEHRASIFLKAADLLTGSMACKDECRYHAWSEQNCFPG